MIRCSSYLKSMSDIVNKKYKFSVHTIIVSLYAVEFYKNFIPLRDKIEAGTDLVRTITSCILVWTENSLKTEFFKNDDVALA